MSNKKSLTSNSIYNVAYKMLNVLFPLITAAYIARVLFATGVGKVAYAQNIVKYFEMIAALGIPNYGIREAAKVYNEKKQSCKLFSELFLINFVSTTICLLLYYALILNVPFFFFFLPLYAVVGLSIAFNYLNVDWFYQGYEEFRYIAIRSFVVKMLSLVAIFVFVREKQDYIMYALISCLAIGGNNIYNIINLRKYGIKIVFDGLNLKKHINAVMVLLGSVIAIELYTLLDTTMIGFFCDSKAVAYYTNSMRLVKILITVVTAISGVLLPRLSYHHSLGEEEECGKIVSKVFTVLLFIFLPCEIGLILVSDQVIPILFGSSFIPACKTLRVCSLLICVLGFSNLFGTQVLLTYNQEKKLLITTIAGAVSNICLNLVLVPKYQQNGAAVASVISETIVTCMSVIFAIRYVTIKLSKTEIISMLFSAMIMGVGVWMIQRSGLGLVLKLGTSVSIGIVIYFIMNYLLKTPVMWDVMKLLKKEEIKS